MIINYDHTRKSKVYMRMRVDRTEKKHARNMSVFIYRYIACLIVMTIESMMSHWNNKN